MGDRANIYIHDGDTPGVYLYSHWAGYRLPEAVKEGLTKGVSRWDDDQYLARILFDAMTGPDDHGNVTGYGISAYCGDGDRQIVDVDTRTQAVTLRVYGEEIAFPFADYVKLLNITWQGEGTPDPAEIEA